LAQLRIHSVTASPEIQHRTAADAAAGDARPVLVYDGDCGFCIFWVRYWQKLTGDRVRYGPYQQLAAHYPQVPLEEFRRASQYIAAGGQRAGAAQASFLTLSHAPGKAFWLALYRRLPGFAPLTELAYRFIAAHRSAAYRVSLALWGSNYSPPRYDLAAYLFLRGFGLIYLAAFVSFAVQAQGLIGSQGILPLADFMDAVRSAVGPQRYYEMPTVFWLSAGDWAIRLVCWAGAVLALLVTFNLATRISLALLYVLYLSLFYAGQTFMSFQWDTYLLECGFLALLMSFATTPGVWLLRWLLFRFMFMSGVVKLASGDPHWWNLSALSYHFLTQPLPTPLAWYAARLPAALLSFGTASTFAIELILPFLIFCPRRLRFLAGGGILLLQSCILLTGNYNWFNLQTCLLCLLLFDDAALRHALPQRLARLTAGLRVRAPGETAPVIVGICGVLVVFSSLVQMDARFGGEPPAAARAVTRLVEPLHLTSPYGLFAVMTTERDEIIIEGSADGILWREYEFRYKPGQVARRPPWNIPHQPRLDWQMWFAALDDPRHLRWFALFLERLLHNDPAVTALLAGNPFPGAPPRYVRAKFYAYTYSTPAEKARGIWWDRRLLGLYFPAVRLQAE